MTVGDDGRADRGTDDLAAGGHRRRAELGLPLLLAARLGARARGAAGRRATPTRRWRFRDFLLRAATGDPTKIQIMYGIGGERRLTEFELPRPSRVRGLEARPDRQRGLRAVPARRLRRGRQASRSSASSSSAASRAGCGRAGARPSSTSRPSGASPTTGSGRRAGRGVTTPTRRSWRGSCSTAPCGSPSGSSSRRRWSAGSASRDEIHQEVCERGYDRERRTFTQYYGSQELDASVLNIPLVGFLPGTDERVTGTIDAIARELGRDGFVSRYSTAETDDGLTGDEGQFLACSFWLVSALALNGRVDEARALFERLLGAGQRPRAARGGVRRRAPAPGRQLPAGVQPPHADPRGATRSPTPNRHRRGPGRVSRPSDRRAVRTKEAAMTREHDRLEENRTGSAPWHAWGPYLSERQWGTVREDYSAGRRRLGLLPARARPLARLPLRRGRDRRHQRRPPAPLLRARHVERGRPDPQGAHVRPDERPGQPRRGRQGVLVLPRQHAHALVHEVALQVPAARVPLRRPRLDERCAQPRRVRVRADRHRHLRGRTATSTCSASTRRPGPTTSSSSSRRTIAAPTAATLELLPTLWFRNTWAWSAGGAVPSLERTASRRRPPACAPASRARRVAALLRGRRRAAVLRERDEQRARLRHAERRRLRQGRHQRPRRATVCATRSTPRAAGTKVSARTSSSSSPGRAPACASA